MKKYHHSFLKNRVPAFSLLELGLVLIIIGVLAGAVFKGNDLLQAARLNSVMDDMKRFHHAVALYEQNYGSLPGDDSKASSRFSNAQDGNGNGTIDEDEESLVWQHLAAAGHLSHSNVPTSKMGGHYRITSNVNQNHQGLFLMLGQGEKSTGGLLTPKQAQALKRKADDGNAQEGHIQFLEGEGASSSCLNNNDFNLTHDKPSCVVVVRLSS